MTTATETPKKARNTPGLLSIILAVVGFALALIPLLGVGGWPFLIAAVVLGIVGLTRKGQKKGTSIAGLIVSVVAMIVAPLVTLGVVASSVSDAIDESTSAEVVAPEGDTDVDEDADAEPASTGTRDNPAALGSEIVGDEWTVVVHSVTFDAQVEYGEPKAGEEFVLVNVTTTYTGDDADGQSPMFVDVDLVTADGATVPYSSTGIVDDALPIDDLFNGGSATGNIVLSIPSDKVEGAVLAVSPGMFADKVFVATK